mmetsp:Transcript_6863/g.21145  ORF Transcript_6863/g.21145 Transcript_6863/m.21145 type:complete len:455 (+) Transcript_6863:85-1449(+)
MQVVATAESCCDAGQKAVAHVRAYMEASDPWTMRTRAEAGRNTPAVQTDMDTHNCGSGRTSSRVHLRPVQIALAALALSLRRLTTRPATLRLHLGQLPRQQCHLQQVRTTILCLACQQQLMTVVAHGKDVAGQPPLPHPQAPRQVPTVQEPPSMQHCQLPARRAQLQILDIAVFFPSGGGPRIRADASKLQFPCATTPARPHRKPRLQLPGVAGVPAPCGSHDDLRTIPASQSEPLTRLRRARGPRGGDPPPCRWHPQQGTGTARAPGSRESRQLQRPLLLGGPRGTEHVAALRAAEHGLHAWLVDLNERPQAAHGPLRDVEGEAAVNRHQGAVAMERSHVEEACWLGPGDGNPASLEERHPLRRCFLATAGDEEGKVHRCRKEPQEGHDQGEAPHNDPRQLLRRRGVERHERLRRSLPRCQAVGTPSTGSRRAQGRSRTFGSRRNAAWPLGDK